MQASAGLMAGFAFEKDALKSFLVPIKGMEKHAEIRDYVDDITVTCPGLDEKRTTRKFKEDLAEVRLWLRNNNMVLNDDKEQIFMSAEKLVKL